MQITVTTANNVELSYDVASLGDRVVAAIVDGLIQSGYLILFGMASSAGLELSEAAYVLVLLPVLLYHPLCEIFLDGRSFGKMARGLQVTKLDGTEPTVGSYLLRWLLLAVDMLFLIGLVVILANGRGQRLGDLAAGTTVIKVRRRMRLDEALLPRVDDGYTPRFPSAIQLTDRDVAIIRDVWASGIDQGRRATLVALAERVATVIGADPGAMRNPQEFLATVLRDHTYLTQGETEDRGGLKIGDRG